MKTQTKQKKGYYRTLGIAIGTPMGVPIALAFGNIAYGPVVGILIGLILGQVLETSYNAPNVNEESTEIKPHRKLYMLLLAIGIFVLVVLISEFLYLKSH